MGKVNRAGGSSLPRTETGSGAPQTKRYRPRRTRFNRRSDHLQEQADRLLVPPENSPTLEKIPLRKRIVYIVNATALRAIGAVAHRVIQMIALVDDALVRVVNKIKGVKPAPGDDRETLFGHLISENSEGTMGKRYADGIPESELHLYTNPQLLVLEGGSTNQYGHAVLMFGDPTTGEERYVQVSSANNYLEHMNTVEFDDYLKKWGNHVSYQVSLPVEDNQKVQQAINDLSQHKWLWGGPTNNCLTLYYKVAEAGGVDKAALNNLVTITNEYPTLVVEGFQQAILGTILGTPDIEESETIQGELNNAVREAAEDTPCNPAAPAPFLKAVQKAMLSKLAQLGLEPDTTRSIQKQLKQTCIPKALELIENSAVKFTNNVKHHLADLPNTAARNMPLNLHQVGPQSRDGFNDEDGL